MKKLLFILCLIISCYSANSQTGVNPTFSQLTKGDNSPIINGASNKVNLIKQENSTFKIPNELIPYITGLLMMNKINHHNSINAAVNLWVTKYTQLKAAISKVNSASVRTQALQELQQGDFPDVEKLINIKTSYTSLVSAFPKSIQTSGDNSPIIIGDYNDVTLTVNKVIQYQLPDGVTINLLNQLKVNTLQLKKANGNIQNLQSALSNKENILEDWIKKYKDIGEQLKNSPDVVGKEAYELYKQGDLDGALKELDKETGGDLAIARNHLLKARIMLLKFDINNIDDEISKIQEYFESGVTFIPSYDNFMEYADFLIHYKGDLQSAMKYASQALNCPNLNFKQKSKALNFSGICIAPVNQQRSMDYYNQALKLLNDNKPLKEDSLIYEKSGILFNMGCSSYIPNGDSTMLNTVIRYTVDGLNTVEGMKTLLETRDESIAILNSSLGNLYSLKGNSVVALADFQKSATFYKSKINKAPQFFINLTNVYCFIGSEFFKDAQPDSALGYYSKARLLLEPYVRKQFKAGYPQLSNVYAPIINYYMDINRDSARRYLFKLDTILTPILNADPANFVVERASIYTDIGMSYVNPKRFAANFVNKEDLNQGKYYLERAFQIFNQNLGAINPGNVQEFYICISQLTELYNRTQQYQEAISFNLKLFDLVQSPLALNPTVFQNAKPQIYSQLARTYINTNKLDSAENYSKIAISIVESYIKQIPTVHALNAYFFFNQQLLDIYIRKKDLLLVDTFINNYRNVWDNIYQFNRPVENIMRCSVSASMSDLALFLYQHDLAKDFNQDDLRKHMEYFLDITEREFAKWNVDPRNTSDLAKVITFYCQRAKVENDFSELKSNSQLSNQNTVKKCYCLSKSDTLMKLVPPNIPTYTALQTLYRTVPMDGCSIK